jgi:hypothetical protein
MENLAQGEDIQMRPSSTHLLALLEDKNVRVEVLDQGMTNYQSTKDMSEKSVFYTTQHSLERLKMTCG